jgi:DNA mismatch repair ATPase MutS
MKAHLMYRDHDFDLGAALPPNETDLVQDLALEPLLAAMAGDDAFVLQVSRSALLTSLTDPEAIRYRQAIMTDALAHPDLVRETYAIAVEAIERERRVYGGMLGRYPEGLLHRAVEVLEIFVGLLKRLRAIADQHAGEFHSEGFRTLFAMLSTELSDAYLATVGDHLKRLRLEEGVLMSAQLGAGMKGVGYVLRAPRQRQQSWLKSLLGDRSGYVYQIADRDENGFRALAELRDRGVGLVASALAQSTDHILGFFAMLRTELAFYVGCLNLHDRVAAKGEPVCFPEVLPPGDPALSCRGAYDISLSLSLEERVVPNQVEADGKLLVVITGANQGGKSTFLRAMGQAQLMLQAGMFVAAEAFRANACSGIFTHFKREEDASMRSGKLDEELSRMSAIVDHLRPQGVVLFNESFASTNEREGSEIARQIVRALLDSGVKVLYVTHMFDLADGFHQALPERALFLRAERRPDGERTFRVVPGQPLPTSYGEDVYRRIFGQALIPEPS